MANPNVLGYYLLFVVFLTLAFSIIEANKRKTQISNYKQNTKHKLIFKLGRKTIFYFISSLIILGGILITQSQGVFLGLAAGMFWFLFFFPFYRSETTRIATRKDAENLHKLTSTTNLRVYPRLSASRVRIIIGLLIIAVLISIFFLQDRIDIRFLQLDKSILEHKNRLIAWQIGLEGIKERPFFGWGPENFEVLFNKHFKSEIPANNLAETYWDRAHNIIIDTASNIGLLGLIAYLFLFFAVFFKLYRRIEADQSLISTPNYADPSFGVNQRTHQRSSASMNMLKIEILTHSLGATFIAYFVQNLFGFDGVMSFIPFFLLLGFAVFLTKQHRTNS